MSPQTLHRSLHTTQQQIPSTAQVECDPSGPKPLPGATIARMAYIGDVDGFRRISTDFDGFRRISTDFDGPMAYQHFGVVTASKSVPDHLDYTLVDFCKAPYHPLKI